MPDLGSMLLRRSLGTLTGAGAKCSSCERTPLAGERIHELDSGPLLCDLCFGALPQEHRQAVRSQRIGASERGIAVAPKAA
jgi:hypothetical protein